MAENKAKRKNPTLIVAYWVIFFLVSIFILVINLPDSHDKKYNTNKASSSSETTQKEEAESKPSPSPSPSPESTPETQEEKQRTKFITALDNKNYRLLQKMTEENPGLLEIRYGNGDTPLLDAVRMEEREMVEFLLARGANPNAQGSNGKSSLHYIYDKEDIEIAKLLLDNNASPDIRNVWGNTPLHIAIFRGEDDTIAKLYISRGANVNIENDYLQTPIFNSVYQNKYDLTILMIKKGAKLNIKSKNGNTLLHCVKDKKLAELFIAKGLDVKAGDNDNNTPLHSLPSGFCPVCTTEEYPQKGAVTKLFLSKGADINARNNEGKTPLHYAGLQGYFHLTRLFIVNGADVTIRDNDNKTPLDYAIERRYGKTIAVLISGYFFKYPFLRYLVLLLIAIGIYLIYRKTFLKPGKKKP